MLLLLRHRHGGHWSFPKGHVENGEKRWRRRCGKSARKPDSPSRCRRAFAIRSSTIPNRACASRWCIFSASRREAVGRRQEAEISELRWATLPEAFGAVSFKNDRNLLTLAQQFFH